MKNATGKTAEPTAKKNCKVAFRLWRSHRHNQAPVTVGDLIVELTDDARRFVRDDKELYEVVAYLLETRVNRCRGSEFFLKLARGHVGTNGRLLYLESIGEKLDRQPGNPGLLTRTLFPHF
ncbi:MAG: hypothetical protein WCH75_14585 [Candidatus Binatia bacterium]